MILIPAVVGSVDVGEAEAGEAGLDLARIEAEWRDHRNAIGRAAQIAIVSRNTEARSDVGAAGRLQEDRRLDGSTGLKREIDLDRARIGETADAAQRAEVMVERTVLLHQDHDMLDILDGAGLVVGRDGERLRDCRVESAGHCA